MTKNNDSIWQDADQGDYKVEPVVSLSEGGHAAPGKSRPPDAVAVIIAIIVIIIVIIVIIVSIIVIVIVIIAIIIIIAFYPAISCGLSLMAAFISSFTPLVLPI